MTETAAYIDAFDQENLEPRYVIALSFDDGDTDITYITSHADALVPAGVAAIDRIDGAVMLRGISGQSQRINPDKAQHTIGNVTFQLLDVNQELSTKIKTKRDGGEGLRKKRVQLYKGETTLTSWDDYSLLFTYQVDGQIKYKNGVYTLATSDIQRTAKKTIMNLHQGVLTSTINATQLTVPITIADALNKFPLVAHDGIYSSNPNITVGYIKIDDEIIAHSGWDAGGNFLNVVQRGALSTKPVIHEVTATETEKKKKVEEYVYLEMATPKMIYAILTGVLSGQAATLPDHWHLAIATKYVDLASLQALGTDLWDTATDKGRIARFMGLKKENGKEFIEKELALWSGLFMKIKADGSYSPKRFSSVLPFSGYSSFVNESQIIDYGDLGYDLAAVINDILIEWNWLDQDERFTKTNQLIDAVSLGKYSDAKQRQYSFRGVFTGAHTDQDLQEYFNVIRDRYAAPPLRLSLTLQPKWDKLQVGDTIRVRCTHVWDNYDGDILDRVFEVQGKKVDWISGKVSVDLFGGVENASQLPVASTAVMQDSFYTAAGTELSTVLTIAGGVVTANGSLTGAASNASAIYYYDGDLEIGAGVAVSFTQNIQLRIKGFLTINGSLSGKGGGVAGGAGGSGTTNNHPNNHPTFGTYPAAGVAAVFGKTAMQESVNYFHNPGGITSAQRRSYYSALLQGGADDNKVYATGEKDEIQNLTILNPDGLSIDGVPVDLRGSGGCGGMHAVGTTTGAAPYTQIAAGGAGGAGGGGIVIICRGASIGGAGVLETSGGDGGAAVSGAFDSRTIYAAGGGGGYPGGCVVLIDGNFSAPDKTKFNSNTGVVDIPAADNLLDQSARRLFPTPSGESVAWNDYLLHGSDEPKDGLLLIKYIPQPAEPFEWNPADEAAEAVNEGYSGAFVPSDVVGFLVSQRDTAVIFKWKDLGEGSSVEIRYGPRGNTSWSNATPINIATKGNNWTSEDIAPGDWTFFAKGLSLEGLLYSVNTASFNLNVATKADVIVQQLSGPDWPGVLTNLIRHFDGTLLVDSTDDPAADNFVLFDQYNPSPVATASYEGQEIDIEFDDSARVWGEVTSSLGLGETGVADPDFEIDYKLETGAYDGFEPWSVGELTLRYAKAKLSIETDNGVPVIEQMSFTVDQIEETQKETGVVIAASGSTVTFPEAFHSPPFVRVFVESPGALFATYELVTATNFKVHVWNNSGTDVGGTISYDATGV